MLAQFRQRFRAWLGRPVLELRIEIIPEQPPQGYPWHAYYAARFAWRDERATLLRGVNGMSSITSHTRPETPDYLEIRLGRQNTVLFPGGLPFHQRHGGRMLDVLLVCPGEKTQAFDLAIGLDREYPMQTALGMVTPAPVVATTQGPPHVGDRGLAVPPRRPQPAADQPPPRARRCDGHRGPAAGVRRFRRPGRAALRPRSPAGHAPRCPRHPANGAATQADAVLLDVARNDLVQLRVDFS